MDNVRHIGIRPIPDDADVAKFLGDLSEEYKKILKEKGEELIETIDETIASGQPPIFAFGKMLNYLATLEKPELVEILAGALWTLNW
jgi:hypothetical protein